VEITEVRITLRDEDKLKAFANVTFDEEFVIRGLKIINGNNGYFVSMPSRRRADGTHQDICHPINNRMRQKIETAVLAAYEQELKVAAAGKPRPAPAEDDFELAEGPEGAPASS
jgi:stage V sporulation protein G